MSWPRKEWLQQFGVKDNQCKNVEGTKDGSVSMKLQVSFFYGIFFKLLRTVNNFNKQIEVLRQQNGGNNSFFFFRHTWLIYHITGMEMEFNKSVCGHTYGTEREVGKNEGCSKPWESPRGKATSRESAPPPQN